MKVKDISEMTNDQIMSIKKTKKGIMLTLFGSKFTIPSKMYPIVDKKTMDIFALQENDDESFEEDYIVSDDIKNIFDKVDFKIGRCQKNTQDFVELCKKNDIEAEFFSGWIFSFLYPQRPVYHAWAVIDGRVFDGSLPFSVYDSEQVFEHLKISQEKLNEWEKIQLLDHTKKNSDKFICGNVPDGVIYIGSKSTWESHNKIVHDLMSQFKDHPSFRSMYGRLGKFTKAQEEMLKERPDLFI